jgi:hypothetical protein
MPSPPAHEFASERPANWAIGLEAIDAVGREVQPRIATGDDVGENSPRHPGQGQAEMAMAEAEEDVRMLAGAVDHRQ